MAAVLGLGEMTIKEAGQESADSAEKPHRSYPKAVQLENRQFTLGEERIELRRTKLSTSAASIMMRNSNAFDAEGHQIDG